MTQKTNPTNPPILPETTEKINRFERLKRNFETAYASGVYVDELMQLATACARSVVKKCLDPQRKTAAANNKPSTGGQSPAMRALWQGISHDATLLDATRRAADKATRVTTNKDGDSATVLGDADYDKALTQLARQTLTDGVDLIQTAVLAILEQAKEHAGALGWLDAPYTVRRLSKRVRIQESDSMAFCDVETAPMREVYRAIRAEMN